MDVTTTLALFLIGSAFGGGLVWFYFRQRIADACERERNLALADIRIADERANTKDALIRKLSEDIEKKTDLIDSLNNEKVRLEREQAVFTQAYQKDKAALEEKIEFLNSTKETLKKDFSDLAADALKKNNEEFNTLCNPVRDTLDKIKTNIEFVDTTAKNLGVETSKLVKALQKPEVRGQWGEIALERILEIAGLCEGRDYSKQQTIVGEESQLRPDYIINMPGNKHLALDSKAPIQAFMDAAQASDDQMRQGKLKDFVRHVRDRVKKLAGKAYHEHTPNSPEFVVLYLPTEAIICAALTLDFDLLESAFAQKVLVAGPTNLLALLLAVNHGWKQEALAENARVIADRGKVLYERLAKFAVHVDDLRRHLDASVKAYNSFVGSLEGSVMPQARRFRDYGLTGKEELIELAPIDTVPRILQGRDLVGIDADGELDDTKLLGRPR